MTISSNSSIHTNTFQTSNTTNTNTSFSDKLSSPKSKQEETNQIIEEILSILRTGFTPDQLENIEKLLKEINKLISDNKDNKLSKKELLEKIKELEDAISKLNNTSNGNIDDENENSINKTTLELAVKEMQIGNNISKAKIIENKTTDHLTNKDTEHKNYDLDIEKKLFSIKDKLLEMTNENTIFQRLSNRATPSNSDELDLLKQFNQ